MTHVTAKLLITFLLLSMPTLSHLNQPSTPYARTYQWYVDTMKPFMSLMPNWCFTQLFGWDIESLWKTVNQKRCYALLWSGRFRDAVTSYHHMMDKSDRITQASCLDWSTGRSSIMSLMLQFSPVCHSVFKDECNTLCVTNGDAALAACNFDKAIALYSAAIDLGSVTHAVFVSRCKAKINKGMWEEALLDAQKVRRRLLLVANAHCNA
jgi:hypothetical protein